MKNDPAPSTTVNRDTECYTVRNTHDCSQVYVNEATEPDKSTVIPSGSFEVERVLDDEYQMKNVLTTVLEPTEHNPMTICLPVMSTETLLLYQTMFFWHTESHLHRRSI